MLRLLNPVVALLMYNMFCQLATVLAVQDLCHQPFIKLACQETLTFAGGQMNVRPVACP